MSWVRTRLNRKGKCLICRIYCKSKVLLSLVCHFMYWVKVERTEDRVHEILMWQTSMMFKFKRQISINQNTEISVLICHYLVFSYWESLVYHSVEIPLLLQFWYICQGLVLDSVCYHWLRGGAFVRSAGVLCISFGFHIFQSPFVFPSLSLSSPCVSNLSTLVLSSPFMCMCVCMCLYFCFLHPHPPVCM